MQHGTWNRKNKNIGKKKKLVKSELKLYLVHNNVSILSKF